MPKAFNLLQLIPTLGRKLGHILSSGQAILWCFSNGNCCTRAKVQFNT